MQHVCWWSLSHSDCSWYSLCDNKPVFFTCLQNFESQTLKRMYHPVNHFFCKVLLTIGDFTRCSFLMCYSRRVAYSQAFYSLETSVTVYASKMSLKTNENKYPETFREEESTNTCHVTLLDTTGVYEGQTLTFSLRFIQSPKTLNPLWKHNQNNCFCLFITSSFKLYTPWL